MSQTTHVPALDATIQKTNEWLRDLGELLEADRETAYDALRGTLSTVRDCLNVDEAAHLSAQLPILVRGIYYMGWRPAEVPRRLDRSEFLEEIRKRAGWVFDGPDPVVAARGVFHLLRRRISEGEVDDVIAHLKTEVREVLLAETA